MLLSVVAVPVVVVVDVDVVGDVGDVAVVIVGESNVISFGNTSIRVGQRQHINDRVVSDVHLIPLQAQVDNSNSKRWIARRLESIHTGEQRDPAS